MNTQLKRALSGSVYVVRCFNELHPLLVRHFCQHFTKTSWTNWTRSVIRAVYIARPLPSSRPLLVRLLLWGGRGASGQAVSLARDQNPRHVTPPSPADSAPLSFLRTDLEPARARRRHSSRSPVLPCRSTWTRPSTAELLYYTALRRRFVGGIGGAASVFWPLHSGPVIFVTLCGERERYDKHTLYAVLRGGLK